MRLLAVLHAPSPDPGGIFRDTIVEAGHEFEVWPIFDGSPPPDVDRYGGVLVFGGWMHTHQEEEHPWLRAEDAFLRGLLERRVPTLGVCLGSQLLVKAIGGSVFGAREPEKGWTPVELTQAAERDPVFGALPRRFHALNWHVDTWMLPDGDGAIEIARSERCPQAFRIGDSAWGVQFHPEVRRTRIRAWLERDVSDDVERDAIWRELEAGLDEWKALGEALCAAFVHAAERRFRGLAVAR